MRIYIFKSETQKALRAFAGDLTASKLPENHGPLIDGALSRRTRPPTQPAPPDHRTGDRGRGIPAAAAEQEGGSVILGRLARYPAASFQRRGGSVVHGAAVREAH
jgi:hypothetical protein